MAKIHELRRDYGLKEVTFVGDRGMVTQTHAEKLKEVVGSKEVSLVTSGASNAWVWSAEL